MIIMHLKNLRYQLSFKDQVRVAFFGITLLISILAIIVCFIWRQALIHEIYNNVDGDISNISLRINNELNNVENLSYRIIANDFVQSDLNDINSISYTSPQELTQMKDTLSDTVNEVVSSSTTIKNSLLFAPDQSNLINFSDGKNIMDGLSVTKIICNLPKYPSKGLWFFNKNSSQGVYARNIYSSNNLSLKYLGTLIFLVDTDFLSIIQKDVHATSQKSLLFITYQKKSFSPNANTTILNAFKKQYTSLKSNSKIPYGTHPFIGKKYYTAINKKDGFEFFYLVPQTDILNNLHYLQNLLLIILIPLLMLIFMFTIRISNQLTFPISDLAEKMQRIQRTKKIESLHPLLLYGHHPIEIKMLYQSYNSMIEELNCLIRDNYEMKLLSKDIEIKALQTQLDPHFLYNTLDSINWLAIANKQPKISKMITSLATLFRKRITTPSDFTSLEEELIVIKAYINIQEIRFENRLEFIEFINVDNTDIQIPKLIIQPLIENIFKHGLTHMKTVCQIKLDIESTVDKLIINVSDNGPGFKSEFSIQQSKGVGLKNIQKRLEIYYGPHSSIKIIKSIPFVQTTISMTIPLER